MEARLYLEINALCVIIMLLAAKTVGRTGENANSRNMRAAIFSCVVFMALDSAWYAMEGETVFPLWLCYAINLLYFINSAWMPYAFLNYACGKLELPRWEKKKYRLFWAMPCVLVCVLSVASCFTGWLFTVDSNCIYSRGPLHFVQVVVSYGITLYTGVLVVYQMLRGKTAQIRRWAVNLVWYAPVLVGCTAVQYYYSETPLLCEGVTVCLLLIVLHTLNDYITADTLTQINNRQSLQVYMDSKRNKKDPAYILMIDVDDFKAINDTYGHPEGDKALRKVAKTIAKTCTGINAFCARYGGDEFVIVMETADAQEAIMLKNTIKQQVAAVGTGKNYSLSVSIGVGELMSGGASEIAFFEADKKLYEDKKNKKGIPAK